MAYIPMIHPDTGEVDDLAVRERAIVRATREYGSANFPPLALRSALQWCRDRAADERLDWRRSRGLGDDSPTQLMAVPTWGSSGDSYGRRG